MPKSLQSLHILSVEDDPVASQALERLLKHHYHCTVDSVSSSTQALDKVNDAAFEWDVSGYDVILVDIFLPDVDGDRLTNILRETEPKVIGTPIIGISGRATMADLKFLHDMGVNDLLLKPATFSAIDALFRKYLVLDERVYRAKVPKGSGS